MGKGPKTRMVRRNSAYTRKGGNKIKSELNSDEYKIFCEQLVRWHSFMIKTQNLENYLGYDIYHDDDTFDIKPLTNLMNIITNQGDKSTLSKEEISELYHKCRDKILLGKKFIAGLKEEMNNERFDLQSDVAKYYVKHTPCDSDLLRGQAALETISHTIVDGKKIPIDILNHLGKFLSFTKTMNDK